MRLCETCGTNEVTPFHPSLGLGDESNECAVCYASAIAHGACYDTMIQCCDAVCDALGIDVVTDAMREAIALYYFVDEFGESRHY
jgi:hypothetical protein